MVKSKNSPFKDTAHKTVRGKSRELLKVQSRIHEIKDKKSLINVPYRKMISPTMVKSLSQSILQKLEEEKVYRDSKYTARQMAIELQTNTRYLSAVVNSRFKKSYSSLINEYRIKDAVVLLADRRYRSKTIEEIGLMVGFANRQSFYAAFSKFVGETPRNFRLKFD
jgi:AraC-like DNA-binding protein